MVVRRINKNVTNSEQESYLPQAKESRLWAVVEKFKAIFRSKLPDKLPPKRAMEHPIDTTDAKPINVNAHSLSHSSLEEQTKQVCKLLNKGLI